MRYGFLFLLLGVFCLVLGCGSTPTFDNHVTGDVTYDGKKVGDGTVTFTPKEAKGSPSTSGIKNGMYGLEARPGSYTVNVEAPEIKVGGGKKTLDVEVPKEGRKVINLELKSK